MLRKVLVAGAAALALTGCMDMKQDLGVRSDGTATLGIEVSIDAAILAMTKSGQGETSAFCTVPESTVEGVVVTTENHAERGDMVCTIRATGNIDRLAELMSKGSLLNAPSSPSSTTDTEPPTIILTKDGNNYRFGVSMDYKKPEAPKEGGPDMSKMLVSMVAGRSFSWSVTAPSIVQTSGQLSEDGKTASYSVPLASLANGDISRVEFTTTFSTGSGNGLMDWIGGLFGG